MKILLVCVHFHSSFGWSIERALRRAGHQVAIFDYRRNPFNQVRGLRRLYSRYQMPRKLIAAVRSFGPDLVFLAKGELIPGEVLKEIRRERQNISIINWFPDARLFAYQNVVDQLSHLDLIFSKNTTDLHRLKLLGLNNGRFLLPCADRELHTGLMIPESALEPYRCQIAFVGSYYPYRDLIASQLLDFDIRIWGRGWEKSNASRKNGAVVGKEARSFEQARVFRGATLNLNTHHYDDVDSLNQRVFDISGSGGCQLVDGYRSVADVFRVPEELETFHSSQELQGKVERLLAMPNQAREMGERARQKVATAHTYDHRIVEILGSL